MGSVINNKKLVGGTTYAVPSSGVTVSGMIKSYETYQEMLNDHQPGSFGFVADASGDPTVNIGFAIYVYSSGTWKKLFEEECMDAEQGLTIRWERVVGRPSAAPADIDDAVNKRHAHSNFLTLNELSTSEEGKLLFKGQPIGSINIEPWIQLVRPINMENNVDLKLEFFNDPACTALLATRNSTNLTDAATMMYCDNDHFSPVNSTGGIPTSCQGRFVIVRYPESLKPSEQVVYVRWTWTDRVEGSTLTGLFATPSITPSNSESVGLIWRPL